MQSFSNGTTAVTVDFLSPVIACAAPEALTAAAPACSVQTFVSKLDATSNNVAATLADGLVDGQLKRVICSVIGGNTVTLTLASPVSASADVVTFTAIGDTVDLMWNAEDENWVIVQFVNTTRNLSTPTAG
jgi:hypothetical protein